MDFKLKDEDIIYELFNITDDMAIDSDIGGDSDADDNMILHQLVDK